MRIEGSRLITDQNSLVKNDQNQVTGVKTPQGKEVAVTDASKLPDQVAQGDLFVKVGNQVVQLTLSEPASRAELLDALYQAIGEVPPEEMQLKEGLINTYLNAAKGQGNVPTGSALATRVAELEQKLAPPTPPKSGLPSGVETAEGSGHPPKTEEHAPPPRNPLTEAFTKYLAAHHPGLRVEMAHIEHALHDIHTGLHDPKQAGKLVEGLGQLIISMEHSGEHFPQIKEALEHSLQPMLAKMDGNPKTKALKSIIEKTFFDPKSAADSMGRIKHLAVLLNGTAELKDMRAVFEVLNTYGGEIKALLPENSRQAIEKLELRFGAELPKIVKSLLPMMENADFSKAVLKFVFASDNIGRTAAVMNFMNAVGKTVLKDNQSFNAVAKFLKMDTYEEAAWGKALKSSASPSERGAAMVELAKIYQMKAAQFALESGSLQMSEETFARMGIAKPAGKTGEEAAALMQKDAQKLMAAMGLNEPEAFLAMMKKFDGDATQAGLDIPSRMAAEVADTMGKMGAQTSKEAIDLLGALGAKNGDEAVKLLEELGLKGQPAGEALALLNQFAPKKAEEILHLMHELKTPDLKETLAKIKGLGVSNGEDAAKILKALGVESVEDASQVMKKLGASSLEEAAELMTQLGAKTPDEAVALIKKLAPNMPKAQLLKALQELNLDGKGALRLMEKMGATDLVQVHSLFKQVGAKTADELLEQFTRLQSMGEFKGRNIQTAQEASHFLSSKGINKPEDLAKALGGISASDAVSVMKRLGAKNILAAEEALKALEPFGIKNGNDAVKLIEQLKVGNAREAAEMMEKLGASNTEDVGALLAKLGLTDNPKPAEAALEMLGKLKATGMKAADVVAAMDKLKLASPEQAEKLVSKLGVSNLGDAASAMQRLGFGNVETAIEQMGRLGVKNADEAIALLKTLEVTSVFDALKQAETLGVGTAKEVPETLAKLGVKSVDEAKALAKTLKLDSVSTMLKEAEKLGVKAKELPEILTRLGLENADQAVKALTDLKAPDVKTAIALMDKAHAKNVGEALGMMTELKVGSLSEAAGLGGKYAGTVGESMRAIDAMGEKVSPETREAMKGLLTKIVAEHPDMTAKEVSETLVALEKLGLQSADNALSVLAHMPPDVAAKMLKTKQGLNVLVHVADKVAPFLLEKMTRAGESAGKALLTLAPRLASSVMKVVPAIGAYPAAKDAVRLNTIAMTGSFTDEKGVTTAYPNREVRALALLGSTTNGADALLAMVEGAGIGNVALPLQLGLAAGSLTLDLMVEYYKDHPEEMSPQFKGAIKAATMMASFVNPQAVTFAKEQYGAQDFGDRMGLLYDGLKEAGLQGDHLTNAIKLAIHATKDPGDLDKAIVALGKKSKDMAVNAATWAFETGKAKLSQLAGWVGETKAYEMAVDLVKKGKAGAADLISAFGKTKAVSMMTDLVKSGAVKMADLAKGFEKLAADEIVLFTECMIDLGKNLGKGLAEVGKDMADMALKLGDKALQSKMMQGILSFAKNNAVYYGEMAKYAIKSFVESGIDVADTIVDFAAKGGAAAADLVNRGLTAIDQSKLGEIGKKAYQTIKAGIEGFLNPVLKNADEVAELAKKLGLSPDAAAGLRKVIGHLDPEDVGPALKALEKVGAEHIDDVLRVMSYLPAGVVSKAFKLAPGIMTDFSTMLVKAVSSKLGKAALKSPELLAKMAGKIGAGLGKAIPLLGVAVSAYDTGRCASIFMTGKGFDLFTLETKDYKNAHARGIASMLTLINGADTVLGIADLIPGVNAGSVAAGVGLAVTSTVLDITMDYIEDNPGAIYEEPLASFRSTIEVGSLAAAAVQGPVALYTMMKLYGANADQVGKALAQALIKSKKSLDVGKTMDELHKMIARDSGGFFGDDMVRAMFKELKAQGTTFKEVAGSVGAQSIDLLMGNLKGGWTTDEEFDYLDQIAEVAPNSSRVKMLDRILGDFIVGNRSEQLITKLLPKDSAELNKVLRQLSNEKLAHLGSLLSDNQTRLNDIFRRIADTDSEDKFRAFTKNLSVDQLDKAASAMISAGGRLSDNERFMLFERAVAKGNFELMDKMLNGTGGMGRVTDKATQQKMIGLLSKDINNFMSLLGGSANTKAGKISSWVLAYGSQSQIDQVFQNVNNTYKSWFGNGGEIVKRAIDFARSNGMQPSELSGKLSLPTLKAMVGNLNGTWTKMFGDYKSNMEYVGYLAQMTDVNGKAEIVKNLMDGWTPGEAEALIEKIYAETTDPKQFTQLIDKVGPERIASELGDDSLSYADRVRVGRIMAFVVERYQGAHSSTGRAGKDVLKAIMGTWSNMSIMTDDFIEHMVTQLEKDGKLGQLRSVGRETIDLMIDWANDAFRDGNVMSLDASTEAALTKLRAQR